MIEAAARHAERIDLTVGAEPERLRWAVDIARSAAGDKQISLGAFQRERPLLQLTPGSAGLRATSGVLDFSATGALTAPVVSLGGSTGCRPTARLNDAVRAGGEAGLGTITAGSQHVLAC